MPQTKVSSRRRRSRQERIWLAAWAEHYGSLPVHGDRVVGRWRPLADTLWNPSAGWEKKAHLLVLNGKQWNLYFHENVNPDHELIGRKIWHKLVGGKLMNHPFVCNWEFEAPERTWGVRARQGRRKRVVSKRQPFRTGHRCPDEKQRQFPFWVFKKRRWPPR